MQEITLPTAYSQLSVYQKPQVRQRYIELQNNLCWYCKNPLDGAAAEKVLAKPVTRSLFPPAFFRWPIHLHHDHDTDMTIGAVHAYCNAVLWEHEGQ